MYLKTLYEIRKLLIDYCDKKNIIFNSIDKQYKKTLKLSENYDIYEIIYNDSYEYHGVTYVNVKNWISYKHGIKIADIDTLSIDKLGVCFKYKNGNTIPIEIIIHVFLHELAHTITIPEQRITKTLNKKTKLLQSHVAEKKKINLCSVIIVIISIKISQLF